MWCYTTANRIWRSGGLGCDTTACVRRRGFKNLGFNSELPLGEQATKILPLRCGIGKRWSLKLSASVTNMIPPPSHKHPCTPPCARARNRHSRQVQLCSYPTRAAARSTFHPRTRSITSKRTAVKVLSVHANRTHGNGPCATGVENNTYSIMTLLRLCRHATLLRFCNGRAFARCCLLTDDATPRRAGRQGYVCSAVAPMVAQTTRSVRATKDCPLKSSSSAPGPRVVRGGEAIPGPVVSLVEERAMRTHGVGARWCRLGRDVGLGCIIFPHAPCHGVMQSGYWLDVALSPWCRPCATTPEFGSGRFACHVRAFRPALTLTF
jgi:hypothetical protein